MFDNRQTLCLRMDGWVDELMVGFDLIRFDLKT